MKKVPSPGGPRGPSGAVPFWRRRTAARAHYGAPAWLLGLSIVAIAAAVFALSHIHNRVNTLQDQLIRFDQKPLALTAASQLESALGYEGFLGALQQFSIQPGIQKLNQLRTHIDAAEKALLSIAASAPLKADIRMSALQAAVQMYRQELARAEQLLTSGQPVAEGTFRNLDDVYANVVATTARLERQLQAQNHILLQDEYDTLQNLLAFLIFVTFLLVMGAWLIGRIAYVDPLQRLLGALEGDDVMNPAIKLWGTERADAVGHLAQSLEKLRQKLLAAPDILVQVNGETQAMRFGGQGGAVFQALVGELATAVRSIRAAELPNTLGAIEQLSRALASTAAISYEDLKDSSNSIRNVAHSLADSQLHISGAAALIESSTASITEISRLTGQQVQASLRDLVGAENQIRNTAAAGDAVMKGFATKADAVAEKLAAATNLMRAGGKVLSETVDGLRARVLDATAMITQNDAKISQWLTESGERIGSIAARAEQAFEHNRAGNEALAEMVAAGERISATAGKLELSQSDLHRAVSALLSQSDLFAPLTVQLKDLHDQLTTHMTKQVAVGEDAMVRLTQQTERLSQLNDELEIGPLATAGQRLGKIGELADSMAILVQHMQNLPSPTEGGSMPDELNALRLDANLQLVKDQLAELLTRLNTDQANLLQQVTALKDALANAPIAAIQPDHLANMERAVSAHIEKQYQAFTADLTAMLKRFEENVGERTPLDAPATDDGLSPVARAVLSKLRSEQPGHDALLDPAADLDMITAITRISQIKKLTGALTRQTRVLAGVQHDAVSTAADTDMHQTETLAQRAKDLISAVMEAITELTELASTISDISQKQQNS